MMATAAYHGYIDSISKTTDSIHSEKRHNHLLHPRHIIRLSAGTCCQPGRPEQRKSSKAAHKYSQAGNLPHPCSNPPSAPTQHLHILFAHAARPPAGPCLVHPRFTASCAAMCSGGRSDAASGAAWHKRMWQRASPMASSRADVPLTGPHAHLRCGPGGMCTKQGARTWPRGVIASPPTAPAGLTHGPDGSWRGPSRQPRVRTAPRCSNRKHARCNPDNLHAAAAGAGAAHERSAAATCSACMEAGGTHHGRSPVEHGRARPPPENRD